MAIPAGDSEEKVTNFGKLGREKAPLQSQKKKLLCRAKTTAFWRPSLAEAARPCSRVPADFIFIFWSLGF